MKKMKRVICMLLAVFMLFSVMAGCGSNGTSTASAGSDAAASGAEAPAAEAPAAEPYTVSVTIPNGTGKSLADEAAVEEAINAITVPEINCKVDLNFISFGQYQEQVTLSLASGSEKMDLFLGMGFLFDLGYLASTGQIVPIGDTIDQYGQGIKDALGDYYKAGMNQDGNIYSVAGIRDMAYANGLLMRKDVLDKAGINIEDINSFEAIGEMCAKIQETGAWDGPILDYLNNLYYYDGLGNDLGVIMSDDSLKVENLYESEQFVNYVKTIREWYLAGYIDPEADTSEDNSETKCKNGIIAGYVMSNKPGMAAQESALTGYEMVDVTWGDTITSTTNVNFVSWQVAHNCQDVVSAIKVLNLMYTDERVFNLMNYGIEGQHYVKNADGTVTYPEGVTSETTGYTFDTGWMCGNQFLSYVWEGNEVDIWAQTDAFNKSAKLPLSFGFTATMDNVSTEVAACSAVVDQYLDSLRTGSLDPDEALKEMNEKLYASGLQTIMDEKQKQLDAWAATNGITAP